MSSTYAPKHYKNAPAFTLAEVLIAKRERGKMSLLNLSRTRELKAPSSKFLKQCAFTLSEVLITLGIIGVVAAMTIPSLINKTNEKEMRTAWKKEFSVINQAWNQVRQDEGGDVSSYFTTNTGTAPLVVALGNYLSYDKMCGDGVSSYGDVCGSNAIWLFNYYKTLSGQYLNINNILMGQYVLKDGAQLYFRTWNVGYTLCWVDVNGGQKKPNVLGKDLFGMLITKDKISPLGATGTGVDTDSGCKEAAYTTCPYGGHGGDDFAGVGCSAKYLYE